MLSRAQWSRGPLAIPTRLCWSRFTRRDAPLPRLGATIQPDGGFVVRDVEPGTYDLYLEEIVTQSYVGPYGGASAVEGTRRRGRVAVTVTDKDVAGVVLSY